MQGEQHPTRVQLRATRERILERLSAAFVKDELGLESFEARVDDAYRASEIAELEHLVADLEPQVSEKPSSAAMVVQPVAVSNERAISKPRPSRIVAILASNERRGRYSLEDGTSAVAVLGNIEIDLRDVVLRPGITRLFVRALLGNVEITVPPTLAVECEGSGILASFSGIRRVPDDQAELPVLRIIGTAVLGNVEVHTRPRRSDDPRRELRLLDATKR
jgi:hypothetical protein